MIAERAAARATARVLVVDDEPDIAHLIRVTLASDGYEIETAHSGSEALDLAESFRPDLVVLDLMMPDHDGIDVCKRLRSDPRNTDVSIIMLTARTLPTERIRGLTSGADDYLAKPFHPEELAARVRTTLHRASQLRSVSPVTRMPGNFDIVRELDLLTSTDDVPFTLVHADLDYFKAYNDHYGFLRGDDAIRATARLIESSVAAVAPSAPRFAGHIGGDDFAVIVAPDVVDTLCRTIVDGFDEMVANLYDAPDRARGSIEVCDRRGNVHRFAFLTISLGVVCSTVRKIRSASEASSIANEMKQLAKSIPGSVWKIDRRRA